MDHTKFAIATALLVWGSASLAADARKLAEPKAPQTFTELLDCRQITEPQARLACYDSKAALIAAAVRTHDLVVTDRAEIRQAKRGLFGFTVPTSRLFGGGDDGQGEEMSRLESTVSSARRSRNGGWVVSLAIGGIWEQTDDNTLALSPKPGQRVTVKKGALGSYFVSIDGQNALKMRRIQ